MSRMDQGAVGRDGLPEAPPLGYRNYWYPVIESRRVQDGPVPVRVLGEDLVLFRAGDQVAALTDRCAHRGSRLSQGRILFPGTLSCPYHGWTYNAAGECVGRIVEGPKPDIVGKVRIRSYRTQERAGILWAFLGEGEPPPLEEDLPPPLKEANGFPQFLFEEWGCDWRNVTENYPDMLHATYVHRTSFEMVFQKVPTWGTMVVEPLPDGKGLYVRGPGKGMQADYPGLGLFPRRTWFRVLSRRDLRGVGAEVRMPGYIVLPARREPYFGFDIVGIQWPVPVDRNRTRIFECVVTHPKNPLARLGYRAWWNAYYRWVHLQFFTHQDKRILEEQHYRDPETLSASDVGLIQWRRLAAQLAEERSSAAAQASTSGAS